jgi:hypothetical protein
MPSRWLADVLCSCSRWVSRHQLHRSGLLQQQRWQKRIGSWTVATAAPLRQVQGQGQTQKQRYSRSSSQSLLLLLLLLLLQYCPACWKCTAGFR